MTIIMTAMILKMNFEDFYKHLTDVYNNMDENRRKNTKVVIPVSLGYPTIGGKPTTDVKGTSCGFDWDNGKMFITPEDTVNIISDRTKVAEDFLSGCIDSFAISKMEPSAGSKRGLTDALKRRFQKAIDILGIEEEFDKQRKITLDLQKKAKAMREHAQKEKDGNK